MQIRWEIWKTTIERKENTFSREDEDFEDLLIAFRHPCSLHDETDNE